MCVRARDYDRLCGMGSVALYSTNGQAFSELPLLLLLLLQPASSPSNRDDALRCTTPYQKQNKVPRRASETRPFKPRQDASRGQGGWGTIISDARSCCLTIDVVPVHTKCTMVQSRCAPETTVRVVPRLLRRRGQRNGRVTPASGQARPRPSTGRPLPLVKFCFKRLIMLPWLPTLRDTMASIQTAHHQRDRDDARPVMAGNEQEMPI